MSPFVKWWSLWSWDNIFLFASPITAVGLVQPWEHGITYVWRSFWGLCSWSCLSSSTGTTSGALTFTRCRSPGTRHLRMIFTIRWRQGHWELYPPSLLRRGFPLMFPPLPPGKHWSLKTMEDLLKNRTRVEILLLRMWLWNRKLERRGSLMFVLEIIMWNSLGELGHLSRSPTGSWITW